MTEQILGGVLMMVGGGALSAASAFARQHARSPIDLATELLGNTDDALPPAPADMAALLERMP